MMKNNIIFLCLTLALSACTSQPKTQTDSTLPVIDVNKEYPVKRIDIHEIADVEYIPLETNEQSLIGTTAFQAISDKYIIIGDMKYFQIIIFDRQGKFIRCINKRGQGPGEYTSFHAFDVDFDKEEIYIMTLYPRQTMWVYSFGGNFLREFKYDVNKKRLDIKRLNNYNDDYLIAYNDVFWPSPYPEYKREADKTPYYLINKQTGAIKTAHERLFIPNPAPPIWTKWARDQVETTIGQ